MGWCKDLTWVDRSQAVIEDGAEHLQSSGFCGIRWLVSIKSRPRKEQWQQKREQCKITMLPKDISISITDIFIYIREGISQPFSVNVATEVMSWLFSNEHYSSPYSFQALTSLLGHSHQEALSTTFLNEFFSWEPLSLMLSGDSRMVELGHFHCKQSCNAGPFADTRLFFPNIPPSVLLLVPPLWFYFLHVTT